METKEINKESWIQRTNTKFELIVKHGVSISIFEGIREAARMMSAEGVPVEVSARVLGHNKRRATDWM